MTSERRDPQKGSLDIDVPSFTAAHLLLLIETEERALRGDMVFVFTDERAMKAAARRGLTVRHPQGWVLTDLCYAWAKQYTRKNQGHLRLVQGGLT